MRTLLVASFLFAPVLLHAQAMSPAQPVQNLESKLIAPSVGPAAARAAVRASTPTRISTGVVAPALIHTVSVEREGRWASMSFGGERQVKVALMVNEKGVPSDLKVVSSNDVTSDSSVLKAVSQFRFTPGTLNGLPTEVPITLTVNVLHEGN